MTYADRRRRRPSAGSRSISCARRTTDGGLILIGGPVSESTKVYVEDAPVGSNIAIVLQRGSPVKAYIEVEGPGPHEASCPAFLETIPDLGDPEHDAALEPIEGTVELRP